MELTRRELMGAAAIAAAGAAAGSVSSAAPAHARDQSDRGRRRPNIIVIMVDEMRFPQHFPAGITTPEAWLASYMPNVYRLWQRGVSFGRHYTAGTACSPSRAGLVTGLYPHQNWCLQTRKGKGSSSGPNAPALQNAFPTYGKLVKEAGYVTPYIGKWHLSDSPEDDSQPGSDRYLRSYGFQGLTIPDPIGTNGQGTDDDANIADQAIAWLAARTREQDPFCLTVSFVNPHDKEFFWSGTEATTYNTLYSAAGYQPYSQYQEVPQLEAPPAYGYSLPDNWESPDTLAANKPGAQEFVRSFSDLVWGGVNSDATATTFGFAAYPNLPGSYIAQAPFSYWTRSQDLYTQVQSLVDAQIGAVVNAIPEGLRDNTIIVFTADHGDYASSHGFVSNKAGSMYEEAIHVPFIVVDPRRQLTGDIDVVREQLTSSVDITPMLATIAHGGREWLRGDYAEIYGERLDLLPLLKSAGARGRTHVLTASDEWVPGYFNYNAAPLHIMGVRSHKRKVAAYTNWTREGVLSLTGLQAESYDYATQQGRLELENLHAETGVDQKLLLSLVSTFSTSQMAARLPGTYGVAYARGRQQYLDYIAFLDDLQPDGTVQPAAWLSDIMNPA